MFAVVNLVGTHISVTAGSAKLVSNASITLTPGELVALVGPNGAGKSSLLKALIGTETGAKGNVILDNQSISAMAPQQRARLLAYLPQQRNIAWPLTVADTVALGRYAWGGIAGRLSDIDKQVVEKALTAVDMLPFLNRRTDSLSGGEMARVHLARCLAAETPLIIADEPLASLDPLHQWQSMQIFSDYVALGGGALIVIHDLALAARFATRIIWMNAGEIVANGPPVETVTTERLADIYGVRAHIAEGVPYIEGIL